MTIATIFCLFASLLFVADVGATFVERTLCSLLRLEDQDVSHFLRDIVSVTVSKGFVLLQAYSSGWKSHLCKAAAVFIDNSVARGFVTMLQCGVQMAAGVISKSGNQIATTISSWNENLAKTMVKQISFLPVKKQLVAWNALNTLLRIVKNIHGSNYDYVMESLKLVFEITKFFSILIVTVLTGVTIHTGNFHYVVPLFCLSLGYLVIRFCREKVSSYSHIERNLTLFFRVLFALIISLSIWAVLSFANRMSSNKDIILSFVSFLYLISLFVVGYSRKITRLFKLFLKLGTVYDFWFNMDDYVFISSKLLLSQVILPLVLIFGIRFVLEISASLLVDFLKNSNFLISVLAFAKHIYSKTDVQDSIKGTLMNNNITIVEKVDTVFTHFCGFLTSNMKGMSNDDVKRIQTQANIAGSLLDKTKLVLLDFSDPELKKKQALFYQSLRKQALLITILQVFAALGLAWKLIGLNPLTTLGMLFTNNVSIHLLMFYSKL